MDFITATQEIANFYNSFTELRGKFYTNENYNTLLALQNQILNTDDFAFAYATESEKAASVKAIAEKKRILAECGMTKEEAIALLTPKTTKKMTKSEIMKLAHSFKKEGLTMSQSLKKAWSIAKGN